MSKEKLRLPLRREGWKIWDLDEVVLDLNPHGIRQIAAKDEVFGFGDTIVRAVNCHDDLIRACEDGIRAMRALGWEQGQQGDIGGANRLAYDNATLVLRKAKGT